MNKIAWINILHFYQPPTACDETVVEAVEKSYSRIINALKRNPRAKFTLNITGCLLEKLDALGYAGLIQDLKNMLRKRQIELTCSAAFHPILPLLPGSEIKRGIERNQKILKKYFGENFTADGFFPPELAYSPALAGIISSYGCKYVILDEISACGKLNKIDFSELHVEKNTGLQVCFRSRKLSKEYTPKTIFDLIAGGLPETAVTATDAELYGLRHNDCAGAFEKLLKRPEIETKTVSEFLAGLRRQTVVFPIASSWESTEDELKKGAAFALWRDKNNKIQESLWRLANFAINAADKYKNDSNYSWARHHLDRGLSSCAFWWASARDFKLFGAVAWNPDEIEKGADELIKSVRSLENPQSKRDKIKAEKLYIKIKTLIWREHWRRRWKP